jgi:hypothetical protein
MANDNDNPTIICGQYLAFQVLKTRILNYIWTGDPTHLSGAGEFA